MCGHAQTCVHTQVPEDDGRVFSHSLPYCHETTSLTDLKACHLARQDDQWALGSLGVTSPTPVSFKDIIIHAETLLYREVLRKPRTKINKCKESNRKHCLLAFPFWILTATAHNLSWDRISKIICHRILRKLMP